MNKNKLLWIIPILFVAIVLYLNAGGFKNRQKIEAANKIVTQKEMSPPPKNNNGG